MEEEQCPPGSCPRGCMKKSSSVDPNLSTLEGWRCILPDYLYALAYA